MLRSRYRRIIVYFGRITASLLWWDVILSRLGFRKWARRNRHRRMRRIADSYRELAIEMGGVLIKMGQFLSARVDVLPKVVTDALTDLQDEVPPEDFAAIRQLAETELGGALEAHYEFFDHQPLAAASLGQVHRAQLRATPERVRLAEDVGDVSLPVTEVVVKVQRPNIEAIIHTDLAALRTVGRWLERYRPIRRRADVGALLDDFARTLYEEIDYLAEGRNAETFAVNFYGRADVRVPQVLWTHTTRRVLTLEDVYAIKITDYDAITAAGVSRVEVAKRLFDAYLEQIFTHEFFHADPHPGNLFVDPDENSNWRLTFVDFGMVGRIPANARAGLREGVIALATQDAKRVVKAYQLLGMLLPHADLELIEQVEAKVFERFWGKSMAELQQIDYQEMRQFASEFRELIYDLPFQVPEDLILLGRCVAILSGMCTGLDPDFNIWESLTPFAKDLIAEETLGGWEYWRDEAVDWIKTAALLPRRLDQVLRMVERGQLDVRVPELARHLKRLEVGMSRLVGALMFAALLMGGVQLYLAEDVLFGGILLGGAVIALIGAILSRPKRGR